MPNVLLTEKCVRSCPYCFAKAQMEESDCDDLLTWENFLYIVDFFEASGDKHISLLGGEPTLHPHFCDFLVYLRERGFHITVFTSGILSPKRLADLEKTLETVPTEQLSFVCNVNEPGVSPERESQKQDEFLSRFARFTILGFNVWHVDFEMAFLLELVEKHNLGRNVRIGLAHPIPGEANLYIHKEHLKATVDRFLSFAPLFAKHKVSPGLDCGLPMCLLDSAQLGELYKVAKGHIRFDCGPAIDIGTDLSIWACFPLNDFHKRSLYEFNTMKEVADYYMEQHRLTRDQGRAGIFDECRACVHRENGICSGGCLAHLLSAPESGQVAEGVEVARG